MKKVINAGIGGRSFSMDEDAYERLNQYLRNFKEVLANTGEATDEAQSEEIMCDIETRIAELITARMQTPDMSVSLACINAITAQLGMPDGSIEPTSQSQASDESGTGETSAQDGSRQTQSMFFVKKRLFRDTDDSIIGGVCSGLAHYCDCDKTLVRVLMVICIPLGFTFSFKFFFIAGSFFIVPLIYLILCIVVPKAGTPADKCIMRGIPPTAENMRKFH